MKFTLLEFKIHGVDGLAYAHFVIERNGELLEYNEMLRYENQEDISLIQSLTTFIRSKEVRK